MTDSIPKNQQESDPKKLMIDDSANFRFHAAYLVYSELFDGVNDADSKRELNRNIEDLKNDIISLETFYKNVNPFRGGKSPPNRRGRYTVPTQRKRDWRMKSQKQDRIRRHKK